MIIKTSYPFMKPPPSARLIRGHRLAQGLVGFWLLNEGSGNKVFDLSGNGRMGTLEGDTEWVPGKFGSCLNFDGTGNYVNFGNIPGINLSAITVSVWANQRSDVGNNMIISKQAGGPGTFFIRSGSVTDHKFAVILEGTSYAAETTMSIPFGTWAHFVGTYDGETVRFYVNGIEVDFNSAPSGDMDANAYNVLVGARHAPATFWDGLIDLPMIYNRALSASEIVELYLRLFGMLERRTRTALMSGYEVVAPPVGMAGAMTTNTGYWGY